MINLCICTDDNYKQYSLYAVRSISKNNKSDCCLYLIYNGILTKEIINEYEKYENDLFKIKLIQFDNSKFKYKYYNKKSESIKVVGYITDTTYIRLLFTQIFPNLDKILYLDCDIYVKDDLSSLYNIDMGKNLLAGVEEISLLKICTNWKASDYVRRDFEHYFNAGIMLFNLKELRRQNYIDLFYDYYVKNDHKLLFNDQDILNYCCKGKIMPISIIYNYQYLIVRTDNSGYDKYSQRFDEYKEFYNIPYNSYDELEKHVVIDHLCGNKKTDVKIMSELIKYILLKQ